MNDQTADSAAAEPKEASIPPPLWLRASLSDLAGFDFEAPIADAKAADSRDLSDLYRAAVGTADSNGALPDTPASRGFSMLSAVTGMLLRSQLKNEPFGAMAVFADGRRSSVLSDFRGAPVEVLAAMAERTNHPTLRARLADVCWVLERKRSQLAGLAVGAYGAIVRKVIAGELHFHSGDDVKDALSFEVRDMLRRALHIGRSIGWDKEETLATRALVVDLRKRGPAQGLPMLAYRFCELDLDFNVSSPAEIGKDLEEVIAALPPDTDAHNIVDLWRLAARAYHAARKDDDQHRCQTRAAEQLVATAEKQPMAIMASSLLSDAIAELHGVPGQKDRRRALRHRLIDVQAGITEEMSPFFHPLNLEEIAQQAEQAMNRPNLLDKLFVFAALDRSPDPAVLREKAIQSIREHPLSSVFDVSHHDAEGKVVHRSAGAGFGDGADESAIQNSITQDERIRRQISAQGSLEAARQALIRERYLSDDAMVWLLSRSPFIPNDLVRTFGRGFTCFFQGDFVSALYILTPLLENSLRHVLRATGHDVTVFDDATQTQEDRTISSLFEQMRTELDAVFGAAITTDIANVFLKRPGPHLRHALAHGLLNDGAPYGPDAIYGCWLIFHLCLLPLFEYRTRMAWPFEEA
jgi:hypothetical protein